jgi:hypothetical protein
VSALVGLLGVLQHQVNGVSRAHGEGAPPCVGFLAESGLRGPVLHEAAVVDAGPLVLDVPMPVQVSHVAPAPGQGSPQAPAGGSRHGALTARAVSVSQKTCHELAEHRSCGT